MSTGSRPRAHGWRRSRRVSATARAPGSRSVSVMPARCVAEPSGRRRSFRRGARARPDTVAVSARQDPARLRPVAPATPAGRRVPRRPAGRARHLRCARVRAVGRAGAARAARIRRAQPPPRARGARPTHRAGAADRPARGAGAVEPRDRPATVSLAPHDQHAPVPRLPEARHHVARRAGHALAPVAVSLTTYAASALRTEPPGSVVI